MSAWDETAITLLDLSGFTFSFDEPRQKAIAIHAQEALSCLFPLLVDGFNAYGAQAIVLLPHRPLGARLYASFLVFSTTGASLGANAIHAVTLDSGPQAGRSALYLTEQVVGMLVMLAQLAPAGPAHLSILMARTAELPVPGIGRAGPGLVRRETAQARTAGQQGSRAARGADGSRTGPAEPTDFQRNHR